MKCHDCGQDNPDGAMFCNICNMPLQNDMQNVIPIKANQRNNQQMKQKSPHIRLLAGGKKRPAYRLVVLENLQPTGETINLPSPPFNTPIIIGRNDLKNGNVVDIDLAGIGGCEKRVSRKHALVDYKNDSFILQDAGSKHGTYVNKVKLGQGESVSLKSGDEIRLANMIFKFESVNP